MLEFKLPAIGEGVVEGEIVRWLKQPGDAVAANEGLVEVMTDKATVEIPSPRAGVVREIRAEEGTIAAVGEILAVLADAAGTPSSTPTQAVAAAGGAGVPTPTPSSHASAPGKPANDSGRVLATPAARALARESGIDLARVPADRGRITKSDVLAAAAAVTPVPTAPSHTAPATSAAPVMARRAAAGTTDDVSEAARPTVSPTGQPSKRPTETAPSTRPTEVGRSAKRRAPGESEPDEWIPFRGMRRRIAESLSKSYSTAVHFTYVEQINVTKLVDVRNDARVSAKAEGVNLNYLPFIIKAVIRGLKKHPIVNSYLDEAAGHIVVRKQYNIGVATATDVGLMVAVVHDADRLNLLDIATEVQRVSDAARSGKATLHELTGSTFTITSLGAIGGVLATPILNYPEVGILGVHAIRKQPIVTENDEIGIGYMMNLSISLDHRIVDGFEGANFLQEVRRYLEDPTLLLLAGV